MTSDRYNDAHHFSFVERSTLTGIKFSYSFDFDSGDVPTPDSTVNGNEISFKNGPRRFLLNSSLSLKLERLNSQRDPPQLVQS
jgi:hypothetical protein